MPRPKWDRQTAIEMGNKGRLARADRKKLCAIVEQSLPALAHELSFPDRVKARLRVQIEFLLSRIDEEASKPRADGARVDRLASALERILEAERVADGRPLPGSRRPPREDPPSAAKPAPRPAFTHAGPAPRAAAQPPGPSQPAPSLLERPDF